MRSQAFVLALLVTAGAAKAADGPPFDFRADLGYLHPEIIEFGPFQAFDGANLLLRWGESSRDAAGRQVVFLQKEGPATSAPTLLVRLQYPPSGPPVILEHELLPASEVSASFEAAATKVVQRGFAREQFDAVGLVPRPGPPMQLAWQIHIRERRFEIAENGPAIELNVPDAVLSPHECTPGSEDANSSNDLHHPTDPVIIKEAKIPNPDLIHESAIRLCFRVHGNIKYNMTGLADVFSDEDLRSQRREFGMCDEKAIVLVSYLRANRIPARVKFLRWMRKGQEQAHACVEYYHEQDGKWFHLDPTWNVFHNPSIYRTTDVDGEKPTDIKVVDVDWPDDLRSTGPLTTLTDDKPGDGRLNPWGDFCYFPKKEGEPRPEYSDP